MLAAQDLVTCLEDFEFKANVAVTSGQSFAGLVGARPLLHYAIIGDVLSRAASIAVQYLAPVVTDGATEQSLSSGISAEEIAQITL